MGLFILFGVYLVDVRVGYVGDVDHYLFWSWVLLGFGSLKHGFTLTFSQIYPTLYPSLTLQALKTFRPLCIELYECESVVYQCKLWFDIFRVD